MKFIKKRLLVFISIVLLLGITGCQIEKNDSISPEDLVGYWYEDDSRLLTIFSKDLESYLIYGLGTHIQISGTYNIDKDTITLLSEDASDISLSSVKIKDDILSFKSDSGETMEYRKIDENELVELQEKYD